MSEWIKLYAGVFRHPKTLRLAGLLGSDANCAVGHLAALWTWTLEYAPSGDLSRYGVSEVEMASGCPQGFIEAATTAGYVEKTRRGLKVHDWQDYAGALIEARERNAERMRNARAKNVDSTCIARAGLERVERVERKKTRAGASGTHRPPARLKNPLDNSGNGDFNLTCYVCGKDIGDKACEDKDIGLRHATCTPKKSRRAS
jgi:hypothetical protein